jgi:DNA transposition AAA+ family ATPase
MALSSEQRHRLLEADIPTDEAVRAQLEQFLADSGYAAVDLADAIGYSHTAVTLFRSGKYCNHHRNESNSLALRIAIKNYIGSFKQPEAEQSQSQLYQTANFERIRAAFYRALENGWAYCIDGAPGTQKTYALRYLVNELVTSEAELNGHGRRAFYVYCRQGIRPNDLLRRIAMSAGVPQRGFIDQLIKKIHFHFAARRVLLVLDEAQHLDLACVETLRELLDQPPHFGPLFCGSHELQNTFNHLEMEQWRSRLNRVVVLPGISQQEAEKIIAAELGEMSTKKRSELITAATVPDYRSRARHGHGHNCICGECCYVSARELFKTVDLLKREIKRKHEAKGATA